MTSTSWEAVKALFADALDRPPSERQAFLEQACGTDRETCARVARLVARHDALGTFLGPADAPLDGREEQCQGSKEDGQGFVGRLVARRYRLREVLGSGGSSAVYRAEDALSGTDVAVKLLWKIHGTLSEAARREVAALRHLRLPGIVSLLDEGVEEGTPFLVMELVRGEPFPGDAKTWAHIAPRAAALLEALGRIHWAGVIHRDLKPGNVLVDAAGRVTIVDLGIAGGPALVDDIYGMPLACTPDYAAPELLDGGPPSERTDLYAVGVLLYQGLTGRIPHRAGPEDTFFERRMREVAAPLETNDPGVDDGLRQLIDQLVARDPAERPASAAEVLERLGIGPQASLPCLGGTGPLESLCAAVRAGGCVRVAGSPGSGRTRLLAELKQHLKAEGRAVVALEAGGSPFSSLDALLGEAAQLSGITLDEVEAVALQRLTRTLSAGTVLICDDFDRFDRWSSAVLQRAAVHGTTVCAVRESDAAEVRLGVLLEADLRTLFAGPDRLFHVREDAAHELWRRSGGLPRRVEAELGAWVRAGLARREGDRFVVERLALEQLGQGIPAGLSNLPVRRDLPARLGELLEVLDLAGGTAIPGLLSQVTSRPLWRVEAELAELEELGAVRIGADMVQALGGVAPSSGDRNLALRGRIAAALPPGSDARLFHLISAGELGSVPAEAESLADRWNRAGLVGRAWAVMLEALAAVRDDPQREGDLLHRLARQALTLATRDAIDQVLYHLARARRYDARIQHLEALMRAALWTVGGDGGRALDLLSDLALDEASELQTLKRSVEGLASRYVPLERGRVAVQRILASARSGSLAEERGTTLEQLGWLRYREERFARAARLQERAARLATTRWARVSALLNAASARMEDVDLAGAEALAREGFELASAARHPIQEARAEWLLRSIAYRRAAPLAADLELLDAAAALNFPNFQGLICLNEAAIAWRANDLDLARNLALRAASHWAQAGRAAGRALAEALALRCGAALPGAEQERILQDALRCPVPGMAVQALGLVAAASPDRRHRALESAAERAQGIPRERFAHRREVISVDEALNGVSVNGNTSASPCTG